MTDHKHSRDDEPLRQQPPNAAQEAQDVLMNLMTIIYMCMQEAINEPEEMEAVSDTLRKCSRP